MPPHRTWDLRLTISADMKVSEQCEIAVSKGNQIVGILLLGEIIVYKEKTNNTARTPARKSSKESSQNDAKTQGYLL